MKVAELIDKLCYPTNDQLKENKVQENLFFIRNKAYCVALLSDLIFLSSACIFNTNLPQYPLFITLFTVAFLTAVFLITCRVYPKVFPLTFLIISNLYGVLIFNLEGGCLFAYPAIFAIPIAVLVLVESWIVSMVTTGICIYIYLYHLGPVLTEFLLHTNIQDSVNSLISSTIIFLVMIINVVSVSHYMWLKFNENVCEIQRLEYAYNQQNNFLLGLSHELRNPLNAMMGNIQLALLDKIDPKVKEFLEQAQLAGEILLHFINNILDSGKATIGRLEVNCNSDCNIYSLCEQIWAISRRIICHKGLKGLLKVQENVPKHLKLDPYRLTQVMLNLVGNAVKFTNKGRVNIEFDWIENKTEITDSCFEPIPYDDQDEGLFEKNQTSLSYIDDETSFLLTLKDAHFQHNPLVPDKPAPVGPGILKITVTDTGCGISPEGLKLIFAKFVQVNTDAIKRHVGTGLGLYISQEIIKKMNGEIKAYSKLGTGTTFIVCIPSRSINPSESISRRCSEPHVDLSQGVRKNLRVLVVDDVAWNNEILSRYIQRLEGKSVIAFNGAEAFEKYKESHRKGNRFDVVAMDYDLPVMNGYDALKKIRKYEEENDLLPCFAIVISGHCDQNIIRDCLDSQGEIRADHFLKKPIKYEQIIDVLSKV